MRRIPASTYNMTVGNEVEKLEEGDSAESGAPKCEMQNTTWLNPMSTTEYRWATDTHEGLSKVRY